MAAVPPDERPFFYDVVGATAGVVAAFIATHGRDSDHDFIPYVSLVPAGAVRGAVIGALSPRSPRARTDLATAT